MEKKRPWWIVALIFFALVAVAQLSKWQEENGNTQKVEEKKEADRSIEAWAMSREFVKPMLKSPSTAKFGPFEESSVIPLGNEKYRIVVHVDSHNSFGAMLRAYYTCELKYKPDTEKWQMLSMTFQK
jgi:hypothetical protein